MNNNVDEVAADLKDEPQNAYAKGIKPNMEIVGEPTDSIWTSRGSIGLTTGYHKVFTHHNTIGENYVSDGDTVKPGERYINYFQIPGFFGMFNANITVEAPDGRKLELITELSSDVWNNISVQRLTANYSDSINRVSVGDINKHAGETYLSGIDLFGISYALNLLKNMSNEPLLELSAFGGEYKAPKFVGDKNYKTYKDYVDEGEVEAQSLVLGGNAKFNLHRRFNGSVGFISREDRIEDPILREGGEISYNTANPIIDSKTFFIDGNWLIFPGDVKMNAQVAVGTADTANAATIRAINQVFAEYGLNSSNFSLLNKLMKNVNEVNSLDRETLESIFGDNAMMTTQEMRQVLRRVLEKASEVTRAEFKEDNSPTHGHFWEYNNWAFAGSFQWSSSRTFVEGFFRYVGSGYYSAGSPDLLQNTRLYGANFRQKIVEAWKLGLGYTLNIENAEDGHSGYNIFGFGEGTKWGLELANSDWLNKHRLDQNRTLYAHDLRLQNDFKISENVDLSLKYGMNYRTRNTSQQLYANYNASTGIYDDPWFQKRSGNAYMKIKEDGRTYEVDSARWAKYYALSDEDYIATEFEERILKHTFGMNFTFKMPFNELKLGGLWVYRTDLSRFNQDDLLDGFDFSNKTYGILGYYFHGGDFFEQSYPLSLSTSYQGCRNVFSFTPRFKMYNRNDSREFEWRASNNLTIPVARDFVELTVNTSVRQIFLNYDIDAEGNYADTEIDFDGSLAIRINHTNSFYSEWTAGSVINFRPDAEADDYKDLYLMLSLNHDF
ncbi:MAG: hypothetical protein HUK20_11500 [Fibrobacter sp.]|nr:hypothetical protein [Fibrobacter sp.]